MTCLRTGSRLGNRTIVVDLAQNENATSRAGSCGYQFDARLGLALAWTAVRRPGGGNGRGVSFTLAGFTDDAMGGRRAAFLVSNSSHVVWMSNDHYRVQGRMPGGRWTNVYEGLFPGGATLGPNTAEVVTLCVPTNCRCGFLPSSAGKNRNRGAQGSQWYQQRSFRHSGQNEGSNRATAAASGQARSVPVQPAPTRNAMRIR